MNFHVSHSLCGGRNTKEDEESYNLLLCSHSRWIFFMAPLRLRLIGSLQCVTRPYSARYDRQSDEMRLGTAQWASNQFNPTNQTQVSVNAIVTCIDRFGFARGGMSTVIHADIHPIRLYMLRPINFTSSRHKPHSAAVDIFNNRQLLSSLPTVVSVTIEHEVHQVNGEFPSTTCQY